MKKINQFTSVLAVLLIAFTSCSKDRITGSGGIVTQQRNITNFSKIKLRDATDVNITQGTSFKVEVSDYSNLVNEIETTLVGDELIVGYRNNLNVFNGKSLVTITMPTLKSVITDGSGDTKTFGAFTSDNCILKINGSGDINVNDISLTNDFTGTIQGSGNITITNGQCDKAFININGSGDVLAFGLRTNTATINVNGSADTELFVNTLLNATINGSGDIYYKGNAVVNSTINGSGRVYKR